MAEVGGMLASAVLKVVTQKLGSAVGDRIMLQWNFNKDLEEVKMTLESMAAVLKDAERRSVKDEAVRLWLNRLKEVSYDIADALDKFDAITSEPAARKLTVMMPLLTVVPKIAMANKMKVLREELKVITNQHQSFRFMADNSSNEQQVTDKRATSSKVEEAFIVGRTEEKQKVIAFLSDNITQEATILPIYGIGGIGKTTLAKLVFNDTQFKDYSQVWVYVSQMFDLSKIGNSIISQVSKYEVKMTEKEMINRRLEELLAGRKILIVLDDLWEHDRFELDKLKLMLSFGKGSKVNVIVTTRDEDIAKKICTIEPYKLEPLTDDMCWAIIKQKGSFEARTDKEQLEDIGREIAMKCGGVALAAQALGYMLQSMKFGEWVSVRNSDIWNESTSTDTYSPHHNVLASLLLSYSNMLPYLRLCFLYCAIFPKGHKIVKEVLIHQWIALGFIEPSDIFSTRQLSENYVRQLLGMSFLQHSKSPSTAGVHHEDVFTMHDLVHDVARSVMVDEILDTSKNNYSEGSSCRYALLTDCSKPLKLYTSSTKIRALHFLDCGKIELHGAAFSSAKCLRVLDLSECSTQKLPDSIGQLKQLRYLNAPGIQDRAIPMCITKLSKLNYLNLRGSSRISALPESIGEIQDLMHLDLSGCSGIRKLPKSFGRLRNLVHLNLSHCYCVKGVPEALGGLTKLQYLDISHCSSYRGRLHLKGLQEIMGNLTELRYLNLSKCLDTIFGGAPTDQSCRFIGCIGTFSNLEHLDLSKNNSLDSVPESLGNLRKLHTIDLSGCCRLMWLPKSIGEINSLKFLIVTDCPALDKSMLPYFNNSSILLPHFVVQAGDSEYSSNLGLLQDANPTELKIYSLENVKSAEEAQRIKLFDKKRISKLNFCWTRDAKRFVEDMEVLKELVPPCTLKHFEVWGYNSVSFPVWLNGICPYLPNLVKIKMEDLPMCNSLPPLGQLQNLQELFLGTMSSITKIDGDFCGGARAFPRLATFTLCYMKSLQEWNTTYSCGEDFVNKFMFPNLQRLEIRNCPKLRLNPRPPRVVEWKIESSDTVLSSWTGHTSASSSSSPVTNLEVDSCKVPLHQWRLLHHLPALPSLSINRCNDLSSSPDTIGDLSSLQTLSPQDDDQAGLPKWLGTSVESSEVKASQEIIRQLTSLQSLRLSNCGSITLLPQWLGDLTSLKILEILNCGGIKSLPKSIQQLPKLKHLQILGCPELKIWCEYNKMKLIRFKKTH